MEVSNMKVEAENSTLRLSSQNQAGISLLL